MPIYTYRCENCGVQFEKHQKFVDQPLTRCPECNKKTLRKVYTPVGIVFKGSGFYSTDHRSPSGAGRSTSKTGETEKKSEGSHEDTAIKDPTPAAPAPSKTSSSDSSSE